MKIVRIQAVLPRTVLLLLLGGVQSLAFAQASITIANYPRYATDLNALDAAAQAKLQAFATALVGAATTHQGVDVSTLGHADFDAQGRAFEVAVSRDRAANAESALESIFNRTADVALLTPERRALVRFATVGVGTLRPMVTQPVNETQRLENRRVEIVFSVAPAPSAIPRERFENCAAVLAGAAPADRAHRMTCVCNQLLQSPAVKDYFYESRAARQARASAGDLRQYTPGQLSEFYRGFMFSTSRRIADIPASSESDLVAGLGAVDESITRSISEFLAQAAGREAGAYEHSVAADIERRTRDPHHIYSCYADYFRDARK